jgi:hypothetical protein
MVMARVLGRETLTETWEDGEAYLSGPARTTQRAGRWRDSLSHLPSCPPHSVGPPQCKAAARYERAGETLYGAGTQCWHHSSWINS